MTPILHTLIGQLAFAPPSAQPRTEARQASMEAVLVALLDLGNANRTRIAERTDRTTSLVADVCTDLVALGYVATWTAPMGHGKARTTRWYGLTPSGVARAKALKEMSE